MQAKKLAVVLEEQLKAAQDQICYELTIKEYSMKVMRTLTAMSSPSKNAI
jgi:hypothetical protein